jgi:hypothetical protein
VYDPSWTWIFDERLTSLNRRSTELLRRAPETAASVTAPTKPTNTITTTVPRQ